MKKQIVKSLLIVLGWLSLLVGIIGIFLPLLPTTPLVLLAGFCFARSSGRFHDWLLGHRYFGDVLRAWQNGLGIESRVRNRAILVMWLGMGVSMLVINRLWGVLLLSITGIMVSIYLLNLPEYRKNTAMEE